MKFFSACIGDCSTVLYTVLPTFVLIFENSCRRQMDNGCKLQINETLVLESILAFMQLPHSLHFVYFLYQHFNFISYCRLLPSNAHHRSMITFSFVSATQMPIISTENQALEMLKVENFSVAVGGAITTLDGNSVTLVCEVSGFPVPQITWVKDGAEIQKGGKSYTIHSVVRSDSGSYTCVATNIAGGVKATSQLIVRGKQFECYVQCKINLL